MTGLNFIMILICLIVFVLGVVGLFKPLVNLNMPSRLAAVGWILAGFIGIGVVAINSPSSQNVEAPPVAADLTANDLEKLESSMPSWYRAVSYCGGTNQDYPSSVACGDVLTFKDAPPACREFATAYVRGERATVGVGEAETRCAQQVTESIGPENATQSPPAASQTASFPSNAGAGPANAINPRQSSL